MSLISDKAHKDKLKKYNINIKTKYIVGDKILERNTNDTYNDDIVSGIRCEKQYFVFNKLMHTEKLFDSRIEYTFISNKYNEEMYKCPNCGWKSKNKDFANGCPYCRTYYNIDYIDKDLGSKYHYDLVLQSKVYRIITAVIDLLISLVIAFFYIKLSSRTFNSYDISKVFIYGIILALVLYYFFYIIDGYIVLGPIKIYKNKQNKKQIEFWQRTKIDKKTFFNNLNYELRNFYYANDDIVDYDILDFLSFEEYEKNGLLYVRVHANIRIVYYKNKKFVSKIINEAIVMQRNNIQLLEIKDGINLIKCSNCGAAVDATKEECSYCHSKMKSLREWVLVK